MKLTRPEGVLLAGILVVLGSLLLGSALAARSWQLRRMVRGDFRALELAVYDYQMRNKILPLDGRPLNDVRFGTSASPNRLLCSILLGPPASHPLNKDNVRYLRVASAGWRRSGFTESFDLVDPWGLPYQIVLDANEDNVCDLPGTRYTAAIGVPMAIWSYGPDRKSGTPDDVLSWN